MQFKKIKLYHYPATRSARVKWALHETVGDEFEIEVVQLYEGAQYGADYLSINPNHCVPTLELTFADGHQMTMIESGAMVTLLADAFPEKNLAPEPSPLSVERSNYLQMMYFGASWMDMMLWQIRIHEHVLPESEQDERTIERYRKKFTDEVEPQLKARLESTRHICGDEFSAADCIIGHNVTWARGYGLCRDDVFRDYLSTVSKRPAFISAFADAHEFKREVPKERPVTGRFTG